MILNPWVGELFVKLIFINFLMQLLSTFKHALRTFAPVKNYTEPGTAQERDWKLNIKTVRMWPSNLLFIVAYFINFKLEFLSIESTK